MDDYITKSHLDLEIQRINDEDKRQNRRLDVLETKSELLSELTSSVKLLASNMETMAKEQTKISARLDDLEAEPAEKWKRFVGYVLAAFVTGIMGFLLRGII